jgi:hypothetical protein
MSKHIIEDELNSIAAAENFPSLSAGLVDDWVSDGVGAGAVGEVLNFMERHPSTDFGAPGALVHFVERFYRNGYEEKLLESVNRKPTAITVWMLNRLLNGAKTEAERQALWRALDGVQANPLADSSATQMAKRFLERRT